MFENITGTKEEAGEWWDAHNIHKVVASMLKNADLQKRGRWTWDGFTVSEEESLRLTAMVIRTYLHGEPWED